MEFLNFPLEIQVLIISFTDMRDRPYIRSVSQHFNRNFGLSAAELQRMRMKHQCIPRSCLSIEQSYTPRPTMLPRHELTKRLKTPSWPIVLADLEQWKETCAPMKLPNRPEGLRFNICYGTTALDHDVFSNSKIETYTMQFMRPKDYELIMRAHWHGVFLPLIQNGLISLIEIHKNIGKRTFPQHIAHVAFLGMIRNNKPYRITEFIDLPPEQVTRFICTVVGLHKIVTICFQNNLARVIARCCEEQGFQNNCFKVADLLPNIPSNPPKLAGNWLDLQYPNWVAWMNEHRNEAYSRYYLCKQLGL